MTPAPGTSNLNLHIWFQFFTMTFLLYSSVAKRSGLGATPCHAAGSPGTGRSTEDHSWGQHWGMGQKWHHAEGRTLPLLSF